MTFSNVLIGADPEVFVKKEGKIISAIGLIGGTKENPLRVKGGALQEDNVLAEFNIDPCSNVEDWEGRIKGVTGALVEKLGKGCSLDLSASHRFDAEVLFSSPEAMQFGCDPDYNVYKGEMNKAPVALATPLRTAGGHVHVGYDNPTEKESEELCKALDVVLGVPSVLFDKDSLRRSMYGRAGSFRYKIYGLEYRTLSNFWLKSPELIRWVYQVASNPEEALHKKEEVYKKFDENTIQNIINSSDIKFAQNLVKEFNIRLPGGVYGE